MKAPAASALVVFASLTGCAGQSDRYNPDMAPYRAVVTFRWYPDEPNASGRPPPVEEANPLPEEYRTWIEDEIILGLDRYDVFTDFLLAEPDIAQGLARAEGADLILEIRVREIADWNDATVTTRGGMATLEAVLWFTTAVGGWLVPSRSFPTDSHIELVWSRPARRTETVPRPPPEWSETNASATVHSGEYGLSFWERGKIWRVPHAYLFNLLVPAAFVPIQDDADVSRSLLEKSLEDVQREIAQRLRGVEIRAAGAPLYFRLEDETRNGATVSGDTTRLAYRYSVEPGFSEYGTVPLHELHVELRREGDDAFRPVRVYRGEDVERLNGMIERGEVLEESVEGLAPGRNLVRFRASTTLGRHWISNTILLRR